MCAAHLEPGLSTKQDREGDGGGGHGMGGGQSVLYVNARLQLDHRGRRRAGQLQQVLHQLADVHHHLAEGRSRRCRLTGTFSTRRHDAERAQIYQHGLQADAFLLQLVRKSHYWQPEGDSIFTMSHKSGQRWTVVNRAGATAKDGEIWRHKDEQRKQNPE